MLFISMIGKTGKRFWCLVWASPETAETPRIHGAELCRKSSDARRWAPVPGDTGAGCLASHARHRAKDSMANAAENGWGHEQQRHVRHVDGFHHIFPVGMLLQPCCLVYVWTSFAYGRVVGELLQAFTWDHPLRWGKSRAFSQRVVRWWWKLSVSKLLESSWICFIPVHYHSLSQIGQWKPGSCHIDKYTDIHSKQPSRPSSVEWDHWGPAQSWATLISRKGSFIELSYTVAIHDCSYNCKPEH